MNLDEGSLRFDFNRADLRPESRETLALIAGILFTSEDFAITITGHTDARGNRQYNQRLSERRARAVADFLIEAGLAAERFTVEGLGEAYPLDTGEQRRRPCQEPARRAGHRQRPHRRPPAARPVSEAASLDP